MKANRPIRLGGGGGGRQRSVPERDHVAQLGRQATELVGGQVQVDQVGQLGDIRRDATQVVVIDVQRRQVGERPQRAA